MIGSVAIVGAGPGDPDLLTRRAARLLARADFVLYDALVDDRVRAIARRAHCFYVGKRAGRASLSQAAINRLLIAAARRGRRVVRLKGGDPFVFGRGGEEALALAAAGIPFEVVPGVTSAVAAPAAAGIPVTHRGAAAGFVVLTGHDDAAVARIADAVRPNRLTLVVLRGIGQRARLAAALVEAGWRTETPAAIVASAWRDDQAVWRGTVADLGKAPIDAGTTGVIVVGEVASFDVTARRASAHAVLAGADHVSCR